MADILISKAFIDLLGFGLPYISAVLLSGLLLWFVPAGETS
jgi:hypothetical protein